MNIDDRWVCSRCLSLVLRGQTCGNCGFSDAEYQPKAHQLPPEALLKQRYLVASVLGEGGFGITYAGWDLTLDQPVAIKEYFPAGLTGRDASLSFSALPAEGPAKNWYYAGRERFLREARILAMLSGVRGIVPVRDFFEENDTAYIVMDFIHGESLRALANRSNGTIAPAVLLPMLRPVFDALILVHKSGILHRDISPDNILVDRSGVAWLIDFGAAEELRPVDDALSHAVILRKGYTPLEQYDSHGEQGPWSDVYALSATIYDLLCGQTPPEAILRVEKDPLTAPRVRGAHISRTEQRALLHALSPQVSSRPLSMDQFRSELYRLPMPEELQKRRRVLRRTLAMTGFTLSALALLALNATIGLPSTSGCGFSLSHGVVQLKTYSGNAQARIPARYLGLPVEVLAQETFRDHTFLSSVSLPETLREIQEMAFLGCSTLQEVTLPQGLSRIGAYAFAECNALTRVYLPASVTEIADSAFSGCSKDLVLFGETGSFAERFAAEHNLLFCDTSLFEYSISGDHAIITRFLGTGPRAVVPSVIGGFPVYEIGNHAFSSSSVAVVVVASGIERIGEGAFESCFTLREVELPDSVKSIGEGAFNDCGYLTDIHLNEGLTEIGANAFAYNRSLTGIDLPQSLQSIGSYAFEGCTGLVQISLPAGVTSLSEGVFYYCDHLSAVTLSEGLTQVGDRAFEGCVSLTHVKLPSSAQSIGFRAFAGCAGLETLYLPASVTKIDPAAFVETSADTPRVDPDLILIGEGGSAAERAAVGSGLRFDDTQLWCSVSELTYEPFEDGVMITGYKGDETNLILPTYLDGLPVVAIGVDACSERNRLNQVVLPRRLETILNSAFSYCPNLCSVTFPASLERIDYYAFYRCNLTQIALPASVSTLGYNAFDSNPNLIHASFGSGMPYLDETVLTDCPALETLEIESAGCLSGFSNLSNLRTLSLGDGVCSLVSGAFSNCRALRDVYLSASVSFIASDVFSGANALTIHAAKGSFGEIFAREKGFRFAAFP